MRCVRVYDPWIRRAGERDVACKGLVGATRGRRDGWLKGSRRSGSRSATRSPTSRPRGESVLVNYRVRLPGYVADRLIDAAVPMVGVGSIGSPRPTASSRRGGGGLRTGPELDR